MVQNATNLQGQLFEVQKVRTKAQFYFDPITRTGGYVVYVSDSGIFKPVNPHNLVTQAQAECMRKELRKHDYPETSYPEITLLAMCKHCME